MKIVVFAYHEVGAACLEELIGLGHAPRLVVTHPDTPGENIWFRSVKNLAQKAGIPVIATEDPNETAIVQQIKKAQPDLIFSFYFRRLLKPEILSLARRAALNMHGSLLPKYRGRCPINWVLLEGEKETGVTLHRMTDKPDQGNIISQKIVPIEPEDAAGTLSLKIALAAAELLRETWPLIESGKIAGTPQDETQATTFGGRTPEDGLLDWNRSAVQISNLVRAVTHPFPGAFTMIDGRKLFIWEAQALADEKTIGKKGVIIRIEPGRGAVFSTGAGNLLAETVQWEDGEERLADLLLKKEGVSL